MTGPHREVAGIAGRVAMVTGAAGAGLGQAVARALALAGAHVVVTDVHAGRTDEVAAKIAVEHPDVTVIGMPLDAGDPDAIVEVASAVLERLGPIQILVNNAALNHMGSVFELDRSAWDDVIRVGLSGPWHLARATMPQMRDAGGGVIINVGSISADLGGLGLETPYAVAKGGLNVLTRALAHEGGPHRIRVVTLCTGLIAGTRFADAHPELFEVSAGPLPGLPTAADVAGAAVFLASEAAAFVTGESVNVSAGAHMRP